MKESSTASSFEMLIFILHFSHSLTLIGSFSISLLERWASFAPRNNDTMNKFFFFLLTILPLAAFATNNPYGDNDSSSTSELVKVSYFDTAQIYKHDWNNEVTFSYPEAHYSPKGMIALTDSFIGYAFPVESETTSGFGRRRYSYHKGIDIPLAVGDNVVSAFGGKVRYAKWNSGGYGNLVIVRHPNGMETYYAHLSKIKVKPNQIVRAGDLLGLGGSTGKSYSPHLHFETRYNHVAFDPRHIFDLENYCLKSETVDLATLISNGKGTISKEAEGEDTSDDDDHDHAPKTKSASQVMASSNATTYSVRSGDSLSKIAMKHGTSIDALCKLNGLTRNSVLQIGQRIRVK